MQKPMISVRRRSTLAQTLRTENWLHDMAQKGFFLRQLSGTNYRFEQGEPGNVRYFLMSPEIGSNSDSWVFYEFERKTGKRIPYEGKSFTGSSLVLAVDGKAVDCQAPLAAFYYRYRNYRLLKRLLRNAVGSAVIFLLGLACDPFGTPAFLPYLLGSAILCAFSASARTAYPPEHPDRCRNLHAPLIEMPVRQHCRRRGANEKISYYKILF